MNIAGCANCFLHGWKQVEDLRTLQRCTRCKLIQYCGKECQSEHWKRIHKTQCRYFADPVKAQKWAHKEEACTICIEAAKVGKAEICRPANPNYECIFKEKFPPHMYHPHPFPVTGQPGHTYEKAVIVLWQLIKKFELTQPEVVRNWRGKLIEVFAELKMKRLDIWKARKISHQSEYWGSIKNLSDCLLDLLSTIEEEVRIDDESMKDLVKIIKLVHNISFDLKYSEQLQILHDPLADLPAELHTIVSQDLSNSTNYLTMANHVLDALAAQVVPYQDLLRIVCGGSLDKRCNFCSKNTTISNIYGVPGELSAVVFNCLFTEIYHCENLNCVRKTYSMMQDCIRFASAVMTTVGERAATKCDFCSKLPPSKGVHRCSACLTVMYCSKTCQDQDWEIHEEFCNEEVEERKKKFGSSGRRKEARDVVERLEKRVEELVLDTQNDAQLVQEGVEVVKKLKLKRASKKAKK